MPFCMQIFWKKGSGIILLFFLFMLKVYAEGSVDLIKYSGYRMFYNTRADQQLKVYATGGEFIHIGTSHLGLNGGFVEVYRPDGSLHGIFDGTNNLGIIYNDEQEKNGPTGGGALNGLGYIPIKIEVSVQEMGIWTIILDYPEHTTALFSNIRNLGLRWIL